MLRLLFIAFATAAIMACGDTPDGDSDGPTTEERTVLRKTFVDAHIQTYGSPPGYADCLYNMVVDYSGGEDQFLDLMDAPSALVEKIGSMLEQAYIADPEQAEECSDMWILHLDDFDMQADVYMGTVRKLLEDDGDSTVICEVISGLEPSKVSSAMKALATSEQATPKPRQTANPQDAEVAFLVWMEECSRELE